MSAVPASSFWKRFAFITLTLAPVCYLGLLAAVAIHEVVGHGLAALLVGGEFRGFTLCWDGMGHARAFAPENASNWTRIAVLAGGIVSTIVSGILLTLAGAVARNAPKKLVLFILGMNCLLEGFPYLLWNAYHPEPPGDVSRILSILSATHGDSAAMMRWSMVAVGGIGSSVALLFVSARIISLLLAELGFDLMTNRRRAITIAAFAGAGAVAWFTFDWNQLAEGIGSLPRWAGVAAFMATGCMLYYWPSSSAHGVPMLAARHMAYGWTALALTVVVMKVSFSKGVFW
jgi:hypothetical protein